MAKTYNKMQIDMNGDILSSVTAVAQDTLSRYLDCNLYNNGVTLDLTGHMAQLYIKKPEPDGLTVLTQGEITDAAAGRVQFELTNQALAETGWIELQIVLTSGEGEVLSSEIFKLHVLPSIRSDEAIESTNEFGALVVLFQEIQNSLDLMNAIIASFGEPGKIATEYGVDTFWGILEASLENVDFPAAIKAYINSTMGTDYFFPINKMISSLSGTKGFIPLDLLIKALIGSSETFVEDGTFTVPDGVTAIKVTAAGGGGGGAVGDQNKGGGGGGGADCIVAVYSVTPGQNIAITIGKGGNGGKFASGSGVDGEAGTATVVGSFVTVPGGKGGSQDGTGGEAGGSGGGEGATVNVYNSNLNSPGEDGLFGSGGNTIAACAGGGGGSYGDGGDAGSVQTADGENGIYGGGGGGCDARMNAGDGGDGIVIIEWGANVA